MQTIIIKTCLLLPLVLLSFIANAAEQTLFHGGKIITMNPQQSTVEAVLVEGDTISKVGRLEELRQLCIKPKCQQRDLQGKTLLPGFIDAHGHFTMTLDDLARHNVASPPVGEMNSVADIVSFLKKQKPQKGWIIGSGYDDSLLAEQRHPTRDDLDKVSSTIPIFLLHVSGHLAVCNSPCLALAGIDDPAENPTGGVFRRDTEGRINGVLEENAAVVVKKILPHLTDEDRLALLPKLIEYYASNGITTVQDGATNTSGLEFLHQASSQGKLDLDVLAYPYTIWADISDKKNQPGSVSADSSFRVAGIKLVLDGSPQGKTAWLSHPYHEPPEGESEDYSGYRILTDEDLENQLKAHFSKGWQVIAHTNGDEAAEQLLRVMQKLKEQGITAPRTVMIHAQTVRDDQLARMNELGVIPSFFVAHTFYWGDWHRDSVLGKERASRISPLKSAEAYSVPYTIHNDTPIVPPDMPLLLWTATNRETRSGQVLGQGERTSTLEALKAITINAAYQHFEEDSKGSIEAGKLADLLIIDNNPLEMSVEALAELQVLETIKNGQIVFKRD